MSDHGNSLILKLALAGMGMYGLYVIADEAVVDYSSFLGDFEYACVSMYDPAADTWVRHNPSLCERRFTPASTFKIYNSLIGLETGVLFNENTLIAWDGVQRSRAALNRDHTLRSAVRDSVVWYFEEVARRVGPERMQRYIDAIGYGNGDISRWNGPFWLGGSLAISPNEQVMLLARLLRGELPFSSHSVNIVIDILDHASEGLPGLHGKTGSALLPTGVRLGWFVGWVRNGDQTRIFAIAALGGSGVSGMKAKETMIRILRVEGHIPSR